MCVKKKVSWFVASALLAGLLSMSSCASSMPSVETRPAGSPAETKPAAASGAYRSLEDAVEKVCVNLMNKMPDGSRIAIVVSSDDKKAASLIVQAAENTFANSESGTFTTVSRNDLNVVIGEQELQTSDAFDENTAVKLAKLAGANIVVTGSAEDNRLYLKALDVETGRIIAMGRESY